MIKNDLIICRPSMDCWVAGGGEMPALGNKGKVFCSFVEYHWDSGRAFPSADVKSAALSASYSKENKSLTVILALT
jgi:hypothetical protein